MNRGWRGRGGRVCRISYSAISIGDGNLFRAGWTGNDAILVFVVMFCFIAKVGIEGASLRNDFAFSVADVGESLIK